MDEMDDKKSEQAEKADAYVPSDILKLLKALKTPGQVDKPVAAPNEINLAIDLNTNNLVQGLIMSEILGRPMAKRQKGNTLWNSRF